MNEAILNDAKSTHEKKTWVMVLIIALSVLVLVTGILVIVAVIENGKTSASPIAVSNTEWEVKPMEGSDLYSVKITGTAKNVTNNEYTNITIVFKLYDKDGNYLCEAYASYHSVSGNFNEKFTAVPSTVGTRGGYLETEPKSYEFARVDIEE